MLTITLPGAKMDVEAEKVAWRRAGFSSVFQSSKDTRELDMMGISEASSHQLGWFEDTEYIMSPNAEDVLEDLLNSASKDGGCW